MAGGVRCRWIDVRHEGAQLIDLATGQRPAPGAMFWAPWELERDGEGAAGDPRVRLAPKYWQLPKPRRAPIAVICPDGSYFCVDGRAYEYPRGHHGDGWDVSGWAPALNIKPSINLVGRWHGYLTGGLFRTA